MADDTFNDNQDLADIEEMLRQLDPADLQLLDPPGDIWDGIVEALPELADDTRRAGPSIPPSRPATVRSLNDHRRRRFGSPRALMLVAAATAMVVVGVAAIAMRGGNDTVVVASADLRYDAGFDQLGATASAKAQLLEDGSTYEVALEDATLPDPSAEDADLELWLIHVGADGSIVDLVSLGVVDAADETFTVPAGIDPAVYDYVDISVEPHDGNHDHSGRSILRGQLSA